MVRSGRNRSTASTEAVIALIGGDGKLPLWAHPDGCDFIRGSRLVNQTLMAPAQALSHGGGMSPNCGEK